MICHGMASMENKKLWCFVQLMGLVAVGSLGLLSFHDRTVTDLVADPALLNGAFRSCLAVMCVVACLGIVVILFKVSLGVWLVSLHGLSRFRQRWLRFAGERINPGFEITIDATGLSYVVIALAPLVPLAWFALLVWQGRAAWNGPPVLPLAVLFSGILWRVMRPKSIGMRGNMLSFTYWCGTWAVPMSDKTFLTHPSLGGTFYTEIIHPFVSLHSILAKDKVLMDDGSQVWIREVLSEYFEPV